MLLSCFLTKKNMQILFKMRCILWDNSCQLLVGIDNADLTAMHFISWCADLEAQPIKVYISLPFSL